LQGRRFQLRHCEAMVSHYVIASRSEAKAKQSLIVLHPRHCEERSDEVISRYSPSCHCEPERSEGEAISPLVLFYEIATATSWPRNDRVENVVSQ
jgi:hypothetical protein